MLHANTPTETPTITHAVVKCCRNWTIPLRFGSGVENKKVNAASMTTVQEKHSVTAHATQYAKKAMVTSAPPQASSEPQLGSTIATDNSSYKEIMPNVVKSESKRRDGPAEANPVFATTRATLVCTRYSNAAQGDECLNPSSKS